MALPAVAPPVRAEVPGPHLSTDALLVFLDQSGSDPFSVAGEVRYALRGHALDDPADRAWWTVGAEGEADTAHPTGELAASEGGLFGPSAPDAALTRGGLGMAVWEEDQKGEPACFFDGVPQETPRIGHVRFARLDARTLPEQAATWSGGADAAVGAPYTMYLDPSVALDVDGRGLLVWREVQFGHDAQGCITDATKTRTRYRVWDGQAWQGPADGAVVPGSEQDENITPSGIRSFATRVRFLSTGAPAGSATRQTAVLVFNDLLRQETETCSGSPARLAEYWPKTATWDGNAFSNVTDLPGDPPGAPYFQTAPQRADSIGLAADRDGGADLVFQTRPIQSICDTTQPPDAIRSAHFDSAGWSGPATVADGHAPAVADRPHGDPVAVYAASVEARDESSPGTWGGASTLDGADADKAAVAAPPGGGALAAWTGKDAGPLRWAEQGGGGAWGAAAALDPAVTKARNPELAALPLARFGFLLWGDGDNDLGECVAKAVERLESVGSSAALSVVVQIDDKAGDTTACTPGGLGGGGDGAYRAQVPLHPGGTRASSEAPFRIAIDEPDMGSGQELREFLAWVQAQQPADRYALSLADHGGGWRGFLTDTTSNTFMGMEGLRAGLRAGPSIDVLVLDACLMSQLEVGAQVIPYAERMVASEDCGEAVVGPFPYDDVLAALQADPKLPGDQLATTMVARWATTIGFFTNYAIAAFRLDTSYLDLVAAVHRLGDGLRTGVDDVGARGAAADNVAEGIRAARADAQEVTGVCACRIHAFVDLADFTLELDRQPAVPAAYRAAGADVRSHLAAACLAERHGPGHGADPSTACLDGHATGLSVYFPPRQSGPLTPGAWDTFDLGALDGSLYAADPSGPAAPGLQLRDLAPGWPAFLLRFYGPVADAGPPASGVAGDDVAFSGAGSTETDPNGLGGLSYAWDLDPGGGAAHLQATGRDVHLRCPAVGTFTVRLVVHDDHEKLEAPENFARTDDDTTSLTCRVADPPFGEAPPGGGAAGAVAAGGVGGPAAGGAGSKPLVSRLTVGVRDLAKALRRGLAVRASCSTACALSAVLRLGRVTVASGHAALKAPGAGTVTVRFTRRARRRLAHTHRVRLTLRLTATGPAGARKVLSRTLTLKR